MSERLNCIAPGRPSLARRIVQEQVVHHAQQRVIVAWLIPLQLFAYLYFSLYMAGKYYDIIVDRQLAKV